MKKTYCIPKIIVITTDNLCDSSAPFDTVSTPAADGGRAKRWGKTDDDSDSFTNDGWVTAGGQKGSFPEFKSVWGD